MSGLELADNHTGTISEVLVVETPCEVYEGDLVTLVDSLSLLSSFFSGALRFLVETGGMLLLAHRASQSFSTIFGCLTFLLGSEASLFYLMNLSLFSSASVLNLLFFPLFYKAAKIFTLVLSSNYWNDSL